MRLFFCPPKKKINCVATIGVFDGFHRGHRYLLKKLIDLSKNQHLPSLIITFWPHPAQLLHKRFLGLITNFKQRERILRYQKLDYLLVLNTTTKLLRLSGIDFFKKLARFVTVKSLVVGNDFKFGYRGRNSVDDLRKISRLFRFNVVVVKRKRLHKKAISSSLIRKLIRKGNFGEAKKILGRDYVLEAKVVRGRGFGKKIGYPTINLDCGRMIIPKRGVYAVKVFSEHGFLLGVGACNIGFKPTVSKGRKRNVEIYILNGAIYLAKKNFIVKPTKLHQCIHVLPPNTKCGTESRFLALHPHRFLCPTLDHHTNTYHFRDNIHMCLRRRLLQQEKN